MGRKRHSSLRSSKEDMEAVRHSPHTPQTQSAAYRLAFADEEFMTSEDLRGVRFQLEYLKIEFRLREANVNSTVVLFGGARIPEPGKPAWAAKTDEAKKNLEANSIYYEEARRFAQLASLTSKATDYTEYVVATGGGPGVMEAAELSWGEDASHLQVLCSHQNLRHTLDRSLLKTAFALVFGLVAHRVDALGVVDGE